LDEKRVEQHQEKCHEDHRTCEMEPRTLARGNRSKDDAVNCTEQGREDAIRRREVSPPMDEAHVSTIIAA